MGLPDGEGQASVAPELIRLKGIKWVILTRGEKIRTGYKGKRNAIHRISPAAENGCPLPVSRQALRTDWRWWGWLCCGNKEERKGDAVAIHAVPQA